jgi:hypothetical protein|tara:strand:+ start:42 stop:311 length:270 start_codon:yes stop_codon:yes gene_type:complete
MKVELDIDAQDLEDIGVNFVKESYIVLIETINLDYYKNSSRIERDKDIERIKSFQIILEYILPKGEVDELIAKYHHPIIDQDDLFNFDN